jgi:hypothetical protein
MSFALFLIGAILIVSAVRGTTHDLGALVKSEFTGPSNFIYWIVALLFVGAVGYIPKLKSLSVAFLTLVIIVLVLKRGNPSGIGGGFFQQFSAALKGTQNTQSQTASNPFGLPDLSGILNNPGLDAIDNALPHLGLPSLWQ